jgi:glycosyltransferase involved in cell wall biosynthesis
MSRSSTHLVLLPTYNTGPRLAGVIAEALQHWQPLLVVVDGSTDRSHEPVLEMAAREPHLHVLVLPRNAGKGAAVLAGCAWARERGFTHALAMDADGQHPAAKIATFMDVSQREPDALVLGRPIFPSNIPRERLHGRKLSVALVRWTILGRGIDDNLYGFRVYPIAPLIAALGPRRTGRRYDFDTEAAVRLCWSGVRPVNVPAPVRYFSRAEGGVSHFHYVRDNLTLAAMHTRLLVELLLRRAPELLRHRRRWREAAAVAASALPETAPALATDVAR